MKLLATFFVPGVPVPQGDKQAVPSGPPVPALSIVGKKGAFLLGHKDGVPKAWRTKLAWANRTKLGPWRESIAFEARRAWSDRPRLDGEIWLGCVFVFPRLKGHFSSTGELRPSAPTYKTTSPDLDKLERAIGDALEQDAGIITNDARIVGTIRSHKRYGAQPGAQISIYVPESQKP
jgi:Holliday junction resolvase RusA-like endonuclease